MTECISAPGSATSISKASRALRWLQARMESGKHLGLCLLSLARMLLIRLLSRSLGILPRGVRLEIAHLITMGYARAYPIPFDSWKMQGLLRKLENRQSQLLVFYLNGLQLVTVTVMQPSHAPSLSPVDSKFGLSPRPTEGPGSGLTTSSPRPGSGEHGSILTCPPSLVSGI